MKNYPLVVETLLECESGELVSYYSKGHHDPDAFVQAVLRDYGDEFHVARVLHEFRRWELFGCPDEWNRSLNPPRAGTTRRGVFPVTIIEL